MQLIYLFLSAGLQPDSVQNKVMAQIRAMKSAGIEVKGAFFSTDVSAEQVYNDDIVLIPVAVCRWRYFRRIGQQKNVIKAMLSYTGSLAHYKGSYYLRYPGASFLLYLFSRKYGKRIISEHQAKESEEIKSARKEHPFGIKPAEFLSYIQYQLWPLYNEAVWGKLYARHIGSIVAVTSEIANYQRAKGCRNVLVMPNGIETKKYQIRKQPLFRDTLNILFLKGTTTLAPWNGIDRLIESIDNYKGNDVKINLFICGKSLDGEIPERPYIIRKDYMGREELDKLFDEVHIGISTLALYRKNLQEASVLKSREYVTRGLPFVYAYDDPDIDKLTDYTLKLSNDESVINFDRIVQFAKRVLQDAEHTVNMRAFADMQLDWGAKVKQLQVQLNSADGAVSYHRKTTPYIYIYTGAGTKPDSVQTKVMNQVEYLNRNGFPVQGKFFSTEILTPLQLNEHIEMIPLVRSEKKLFRSIHARRHLMRHVGQYLNSIPHDNHIYMRYPGAGSELFRISRKFGKRMGVEFQSKDREEIKIFRRQNPFSFRPSSILSYAEFYIYPLWCEKWYAGRIVRNIAKRVAVTNEIAEHYRTICKQSTTDFFVAANGINEEQFSIRKIPAEFTTVNLLFLSGASSSAPWYGLDRLINSIDAYKGTAQFRLFVIGNTEAISVVKKPFVEYIPYQDAHELDAYFDRCHLAVGPLGMSRIKLAEASPLKVREYFSRGIPFIYAYNDTDIDKHREAQKFALQFPNDKSLIDMDSVYHFAATHQNDRKHAETMRKIASEHLSYKVKMKNLGNFLNDTL